MFLVPRFVAWLLPEDCFGKPAPLQDLSEHIKFIKGGPVNLNQNKIVVLEFWATWCPPCLKSIPHLSELHDKFHGKGVDFIGLSKEDEQIVSEFVQGMGNAFRYPVAIDDGEVARAFNVSGIPTAFVIDEQGYLLWKGHPSGLEPILKQALTKSAETAEESHEKEE